MLEFLKGLFLVLHFFYYTLMTFLMMFSEVLLSMPMIVLSVATTKIGFWTWIWHSRHRTGAISGLLISMLEKLWLSPLNWAGALAWYILLKLPPRKLEPWFVLRSFFLLRLLCISINLPYGHVWNTVVMSGLLLLVGTWNCWISCKNGYAELLVLHCCLSWTLGSSSKCSQLKDTVMQIM